MTRASAVLLRAVRNVPAPHGAGGLVRHPRIGLHSMPPFAALGKNYFCTFPVTFLSLDGNNETEVKAKPGQTILEVAHEHDIDIEGACGGECACSTCHIIFEQAAFNAMPEPDEDELDMLDLAAQVTDRSRLGCQIKLQKERDTNLRIFLPEGY
mmetsp:Transcript_98156/g.194381  ORF Transcript_98156/g.194381 Transcript_98156/m.194381 type:complete len:154 (+) Transcript_98156:198-659(+)|eukprot:CAMPEP_0172724452 /NCGR_PEP_ID=MMETSP1074-20121228/86023_1 /TAXON_ID=2916 /ORGANISM="Ceratium fusus, Strain PA161109" /LENGTH=153 /DNA_ID=CAMNT_0013550935 /DNA_START=46 /DNA_END=507 /DNA_ORIENTATION=+